MKKARKTTCAKCDKLKVQHSSYCREHRNEYAREYLRGKPLTEDRKARHYQAQKVRRQRDKEQYNEYMRLWYRRKKARQNKAKK